jgi:hypothetical protein
MPGFVEGSGAKTNSDRDGRAMDATKNPAFGRVRGGIT